MTKSNPKLQLQTLKEVAVCSQYASINARLNSKAFFTAKVSTNDKDTICVIPKDTSHFSFMAFGDYNTSYFYAFASLSAQISSVGEGSIKYVNGRFEVKLSNWSYVSIISASDFICEVK